MLVNKFCFNYSVSKLRNIETVIKSNRPELRKHIRNPNRRFGKEIKILIIFLAQ